MTQLKRDIFVTTQWTRIIQAAQADSTDAQNALEELCRTYWYPLYAYVRRRGYSAHDAEDSTQGFFAKILKLQSLNRVRADKGRFRAFLLASMNHYLADEWDKASAQKRSSEKTFSVDAKIAEDKYQNEPRDNLTPEKIFERRWAVTLLEKVVQRLEVEYGHPDRKSLFEQIRFSIIGDKNTIPYADLARNLQMSEEALRVAVHRLRQRYRVILREEIARTVGDDSEIQEELNCLRRVLSS